MTSAISVSEIKPSACEQQVDLTDPNGDRYVGGWKNGLMHGQGTYTCANGSRYVGGWQKGLRHGVGDIFFSNGDRYTGCWNEGYRHGHGAYSYSNGCQYIGGWENSLEHGEGRVVFPNKEERKGEWIRGWPKWARIGSHFFDINRDDISKVAISKIEPFAKALILQSECDHNFAFGIAKGVPEKLAKILELGGFSSKVIYFNSVKSLQEAIAKHSKTDLKVNLVWLRAHGSSSGSYILCGENDLGDASTLSALSPLLSTECSLVFESCNLGKPNALAEKLFLELSGSGYRPTIIASKEKASASGLNLASLRNKKLEISLFSTDTHENVARIFKVSQKRKRGETEVE